MNGAWVYIGERVVTGTGSVFRAAGFGRYCKLVVAPAKKLKSVYRYRWPEVAND